jgi:ELWxxDGT repeat protein
MLKVSTRKSVIASLKISLPVYFFAFFLILWTKPLLAQDLVRDISVSTRNTVVRDTCMVDSTFYFTTVSLETGVKTLWCTNGQTNGTIALANSAQPGGPSSFDRMTAWKGKLFFAAGEKEHRDLWVSDGTVAGTKKFKTDVGFFGFEEGSLGHFYKGKNYLFFLSEKDASEYNGIDIWRTDGTTEGTVFLKSTYLYSLTPYTLIEINGLFYFTSMAEQFTSPTRFEQLWVTDGNSVTFLANLTDFPNYTSTLRMRKLGNQLILAHIKPNSIVYMELWKSNGTPEGTVKYTEYNVGRSYTDNFEEAIEMDGVLFFKGKVPEKVELWRTDGTAAGTYAVSNFSVTLGNSRPEHLIILNHQVIGKAIINDYTRLFRVNGINSMAEEIVIPDLDNYQFDPEFIKFGEYVYFNNFQKILRTDGSTVTDFFTHNSTYYVIDAYYVANNKLLYTAYNLDYKHRIFTTDGNTEIDLAERSEPGFVFRRVIANNSRLVYFLAYDDVHGEEIWRTDGTVAGTFLLKDIRDEKASSSPKNLISVGDRVYFLASNEKTGTELWRHDTKTNETVLHYEFTPDDTLSNFNGLVNYNNKGFIMLNSSSLRSITPTAFGSVGGSIGTDTYPANFTVSNGKLFSTMYSYAGIELWTSMGTVYDTKRVKIINNVMGSKPAFLTDVNGTLFFAANAPYSGYELWKSNGEEAGTVKVKEITAGNDGTVFNYLFNSNGTLLFITDNGKKLWKSNGTDAGTVILRDFGDGTIYNNFVNYKGFTYFVANDPVNGDGLWRTDGTTFELVRAMSLNLGSQTAFEVVLFKGSLFFTANNQLWKSDGTYDGTLVYLSIPCSNLLSTEEELFFKGCDASGCELWKSNGGQTNRLKDIYAGAGSSNPNNFLFMNGKLFFAANDGVNGEELWAYKVCYPEKTISENYPNGITKKIEVSEKISSTSTVQTGAVIKHDAGKAIILSPGFQVQNGGVYKAYINGCADDGQ